MRRRRCMRKRRKRRKWRSHKHTHQLVRQEVTTAAEPLGDDGVGQVPGFAAWSSVVTSTRTSGQYYLEEGEKVATWEGAKMRRTLND